jgi:hypothetical protein
MAQIYERVVAHTWNPALRRLRQEDHRFEVNLGSEARPCLNKDRQVKNKKLIMAIACSVVELLCL